MEQPIVGFHFFVEVQRAMPARPGVLVLIAPTF